MNALGHNHTSRYGDDTDNDTSEPPPPIRQAQVLGAIHNLAEKIESGLRSLHQPCTEIQTVKTDVRVLQEVAKNYGETFQDVKKDLFITKDRVAKVEHDVTTMVATISSASKFIVLAITLGTILVSITLWLSRMRP